MLRHGLFAPFGLHAKACLMLIDVASALGYTKCFALPKASAGSCCTCARMYPNSPKVPGLGSGLAELSQLENRISPAKKLHAGSPRTRWCKWSAAVAHFPGLQLTAGSAQPVRRAGRATTAARVSADPRVKAELALCPPPNSGSFSPTPAGSSAQDFPCHGSPVFLWPSWLLLAFFY